CGPAGQRPARRGGRREPTTVRRLTDGPLPHIHRIRHSVKATSPNPEKHPWQRSSIHFHPTLTRPPPVRSSAAPTAPPTTPRNTRAPAPPADTPYQTGPTVDPGHPHTHPSHPDLPSTHLGYPQIHPHCAPGLPWWRPHEYPGGV